MIGKQALLAFLVVGLVSLFGCGDSADSTDAGGESSSNTANTGGGGGGGGGGGNSGETCDFNGVAAVKLDVNVTWGGGLAVEEGGGLLEIWFKAALDHNGDIIAVTGQPCEVLIPDFQTNALAGNEPIGTAWPDGIWSKSTMPNIDLQVNLDSSTVGSNLIIPSGPMVVGAQFSDPLNDAWPASWSGLDAVDHDGDGKPGVTTVAKTGGDYGLPRLDIVNDQVRAEAIYLAFRTILSLDGKINSCESATGTADFSMEQHAVGCRVSGGDDCSTDQVDLLDANMPVFDVTNATFTLQKVADSATCTDILSAIP